MFNMLKDNYNELLKNIDGFNPVIVAATKYVDSNTMRQLYNLGLTNFGENRDEAFLKKYDELKDLNITWHFIGNLQSRKVRGVINKIDYLHSLNRLSLAKEIQKEAKKTIKCFIEVNISKEESKQGILVEELDDFLNDIKDYDKIEVVGLMTMAPNTKDLNIINNTFKGLKELKDKLVKRIPTCIHLSMGMSNDYMLALKNEADYIRIGSVLFKEWFNVFFK